MTSAACDGLGEGLMWQGHLESQAWQQVLILFRKRDEEGATSWMRPPPLPSEAAHGRRHASC